MSRRPADPKLRDAGARRRAATDFEVNLVVEAGAGTGKTSLLVERVLTAIGTGRLRITELAAITFTDKAAGEMRHRVARELERLRVLARSEPRSWNGESEADRAFAYLSTESGSEPPKLAERALDALENLDRARIVTIHAFCSELLREHPFEAGVDPGFTPDHGDNERARFDEAWERFVARELGPEPPRPELWRRLLARVPLSEVGEAVRELAGFGFPESMLAEPERCAATSEMLAALAMPLIAETESFLKRAEGVTAASRKYFESMLRAMVALHEGGLEAFRRAIESTPAVMPKLDKRRGPEANTKLEGVGADEFDRLSKSLAEVGSDLFYADDDVVRMLLEAAAPFVTAFRDGCLRQGLVSYDGLLGLARDLLRDHPRVRERMKRRYRMLLVDEFQDTDPLQYEIVLFLAEREGGEARDAYAAELEPGRLFIVGDAKQSIYRFRGADYTAYRSAVRRICARPDDRQDLTTNFRSLPGVVDPVNRLFAEETSVAWTGSDHQPPYVSIHAHREPPDRSARVELWSLEAGPGILADAKRRAEGQVLAAEIERLVAEGRVGGYGEISILLRSFGSVSHYLRALREREIPFVVGGGKEFMARPEVSRLMATLRALCQPADQAALLAFLRSPAGGVTDAELAAFAAAGGRWDWRVAPQASECKRIEACFGLLRELERETRHLPPDRVVWRVVEATRMRPLDATAYEGAQRVANLDKLAEVAGALARDGRLSLEQVVDALRDGRLPAMESESPLADDQAQAVRVSTIHGMKGLENRWVILPDLARGSLGSQRPALEVQVARPGTGRPVPAIRFAGMHGSGWAWMRRENSLHDLAEEVRVLYVALTRARDHLVLLTGPPGSRSAWLSALTAWGFDPSSSSGDRARLCDGLVLHRSLAATPAPARTESVESGGNEPAVEAYETTLDRLRREARRPPVAPSRHGETERAEEPEHGETDWPPARRELGLAVGILVHRLLERWDGRSGEQLEEQARRLAPDVARDCDVEQAELEREAAAIVAAFLGSELAERFRRIEIVDRELTLLLRDGGAVYRGSIDLLYREPGGEYVVADFKTDREPDEERLRADYSAQLEIYARAVQQSLGLSDQPRAELWQLRTGRRIPK